MVSHNTSSNIDNFFDCIRNNIDLSGFQHIDFDKLGNGDKNNIEEAIYDMMATFKTPLEIANPIPKSLYERVEKKWKFSMMTKR